MKKTIPALFAVALVLIIGFLGVRATDQARNMDESHMSTRSQTSTGHGSGMLLDVLEMATGTLGDVERVDLLFVFEEEKMARDVYATLGKQWGWQVIGHVSRSEQMHMSAVGALLDRYNVPEPSETDTSGVYADASLQALYDRLSREGARSALDAVQAGLFIEEFDIADLQMRMGRTDNPDILRVYEYLLAGSYMHLRHFSGRLAQLGGTHTPQVLSADAYNEALSAGGSGMMGGRRGGGGMMGR